MIVREETFQTAIVKLYSVNYHKHVGFDILTVGTTKSMVSWIVKLHSSETAKHFGGTYCFHLQRQRMSQARR
jgi:hypothetical protein